MKPPMDVLGVKTFSLCFGRALGSDGYLIWDDKAFLEHGQLFHRVPVVERHTWSVNLRKVRLTRPGTFTETSLACTTATGGGCSALVDTGTSLLGAPRQVGQRLHWLLARKVPDNPSEIDCRGFPGPDLVFELAGGVNVTVGPEDYSRSTAMRVLSPSLCLCAT